MKFSRYKNLRIILKVGLIFEEFIFGRIEFETKKFFSCCKPQIIPASKAPSIPLPMEMLALR